MRLFIVWYSFPHVNTPISQYHFKNTYMVHSSLVRLISMARRYMYYISSLRCCWDQAWKYMVSATLQLTNIFKRKLNKQKQQANSISYIFFGVGGWERRHIRMLFQVIANSNWGSAAPAVPLPGIFKLIGWYEKDAVCIKVCCVHHSSPSPDCGLLPDWLLLRCCPLIRASVKLIRKYF